MDRPRSAGQMRAVKRPRVLVVDDDPHVLSTTEALLSLDVDVVTCSSARQALRLLATETFHLVCADYQMPAVNGEELLDQVAALAVPTAGLLLTGAEEFRTKQKQSEHHYVLLKPFDPARLLALVLQLARLTEMKRQVHFLSDMVGTDGTSVPPGPSPRKPE